MGARRRDVPGALRLAMSALPGRRLVFSDLWCTSERTLTLAPFVGPGDPEPVDLTEEAHGAQDRCRHQGGHPPWGGATDPPGDDPAASRGPAAPAGRRRAPPGRDGPQGYRDPMGAIGAADAV